MSRRAAEKAIAEGRVLINGRTAELGECADIDTDDIIVDGSAVRMTDPVIYVMLNKPAGYVTTLHDEKGRHDVSSLVESVGTRLFPVGRLDLNSEGLLIMTNDGEFANAVMHPAGNISKTYLVEGKADKELPDIEMLKEPIVIDGRKTSPARVSDMKRDNDRISFEITISEGRNRQVRRLCERSGIKVLRLIRIKEGPLSLGNLQSGKFRYLTALEIGMMKSAAGL